MAAPEAEALALYQALADLRRQGFTCPSGKNFAPNTDLFEFDCRAWSSARSYSRDMAEQSFFGHATPSGQGPCEYTLAFGLQLCSQNLAGGQADARSALEAWKASAGGHCENMMDPSFNRVGAGFYSSEASKYKYYWTLNLGTDDCPADGSCLGAGPKGFCASCRDLNTQGCRAYQGYAGSAACSAPWPASQCAKTCGICKPDCVDESPACNRYNGYAGSWYCTSAWFGGWAPRHCPLTCGLC